MARKVRAISTTPRHTMNGLESKYATYLDGLKRLGQILDWKFEPFKLRLTEGWKTTYCPDFLVITKDGFMELHETKGFMRDDANLKIKIAADIYVQFTFRLVQWLKGRWEIRVI